MSEPTTTNAAVNAVHPGVWAAIGAAAVAFVKGLPALARHVRGAYVTSKRSSERLAFIEANDERHEREITAQFAIEERADRRRMEAEIRQLREELRQASVELVEARLERTRSSEDLATALELVATLRTQVDMSTQLIERQKKQIDELVRRLMEGAA